MIPTLLLALDVLACFGSFPPEGLAPRLAATEACFVHAVPIHSTDHLPRYPSGWEIVRTDRESGAMTILLRSGILEVPTRRQSFRERRILGTCVGAGSLVLLVWESGRLWDRPRMGQSRMGEGALMIVIRELGESGTTSQFRWMEPSGLESAAVPPEQALLGPLTIFEGRIHVFGTPAPEGIPRFGDR